MDATSGIALQYCKRIENNTQDNSPMFFCFPDKKSAALWTSIAILTNYFLEDYINNVVDGIVFKIKDKVKIFNCIAEIERITEDQIFLCFSDQGGIPINKKLKSQLSKVSSTRSLSLKKRFAENYKNAKNQRNAISKILLPNDSETINQNNLDSKVLLIAGRGNITKTHDLLNQTIIYDEPLHKIFPENKNLIISPDLKNYKDLFNLEKEDQLIKFKVALKTLEDMVELDLKKIVNELNIILENEGYISHEFNNIFISFIEDYKNEIYQLKFIETLYPGIQDSLPENLRAVVINDIDQIYTYQDTINGFLKKKIPVIFISDRIIDNKYEIDFYKKLFSVNAKYFRLNWNKKKVTALSECSSNVNYIDNELWKQCLRYSRQQVNIIVSPNDGLDLLIPKVLKIIRDLDSFEILQKAFYNFFYPALFALKNSHNSNISVLQFIIEFKKVFDEVKINGLPKDIIQDFDKAINLAINFSLNTKKYNFVSYVFSDFFITSINKRFFIPLDKSHSNIPTSNTNNILFTGYPYNEFTGKYLLNSICRDFIPKVTILCWPNESTLTMNYLKRRIKSSYFSDYLFENIPIRSEFILKNEIDFDNEIKLFLNFNSNEPIEITHEENLEYLHKFKYKGYHNKTDGEIIFSVKCNILNFDDGSFMFLPKQSTILSEIEDNRGEVIVKESYFNDLSIGNKIFKYKKDRGAYREISKNDKKIKDCFEKLEIWKNALEKIYNNADKNIDTLEILLNQTKEKYNIIEGNPNRSSIQRWLFDDEIICPRPNNLKIILLAAKVEENDKKLTELINAYKEVNSYTIGLSNKIKKNIAIQISSKTLRVDTFFVDINGNQIPVETRLISSLDKNEIEIDYRNSRKILC